MRAVPLHGNPFGDKRMSALGFGCGALLGRASRAESDRAIGLALDEGITFFDTARSYGYGHAEAVLGEALHGRREDVVLCTKFGILPRAKNWKTRALPLARRVVRLFPGLRKAAQSQAATQFQSGQFDVATLQSSLEQSLRALRTPYVDMLLLHAAPESAPAQDDLLAALARLVEEGKVRMAGISAEQPVMEKFLAAPRGILRTAQFALHVSNLSFAATTARHSDLLLVANHPYGGPGGVSATCAAVERMSASPLIVSALAQKLRDSRGDARLLPEVLLNVILDGTGVSAVTPAMIQPAHIRANVRAVNECRFTSEEIAQMRSVLAESSFPAAL